MDSSLKVSCTLIQAGPHYLILPNSAIAEVVVTKEFSHKSDHPTWSAGQTQWDNQNVELISFEHLGSKSGRHAEGSSHIVLIIRNPIPHSQPKYFGVIASTIPQIVQANSSALRKDLRPSLLHDYSMSYVLINGRPAIIPDIARIANLIKEKTR